MGKDRMILFHLDKDVLPIDELQACISEFFAMIQSATEDCLSDVKWLAEIQKGSVALATYPFSETETDEEIDQCLATMRDDFVLIQGGAKPTTLTQKTMKHYANMTRLFRYGAGLSGNPTIIVSYPGIKDYAPISMVDFDTPTVRPCALHSFGTAYGEVKSLFSSGRPYFVLYDEATSKRLKVFYPDDLLDAVRECYRNYVRVTGEIEFNEDGTKREMEATDIEVVQRCDGASISSLFGMFGDK